MLSRQLASRGGIRPRPAVRAFDHNVVVGEHAVQPADRAPRADVVLTHVLSGSGLASRNNTGHTCVRDVAWWPSGSSFEPAMTVASCGDHVVRTLGSIGGPRVDDLHWRVEAAGLLCLSSPATSKSKVVN